MRIKEYEKNDSIILSSKTKILYNHKYNNDFDETTFTIENIDYNRITNQVIINFCKTGLEYSISVNIKDKKSNVFHKNSLSLYNDSLDIIYPAYKILNLEFSDGSYKEFNEYSLLTEDSILDDIYFVIYHDSQFQDEEVLQSFYIITPLLKDLIDEFIKFRRDKFALNNKKLVRNN